MCMVQKCISLQYTKKRMRICGKDNRGGKGGGGEQVG